jgi:hypothetical protein
MAWLPLPRQLVPWVQMSFTTQRLSPKQVQPPLQAPAHLHSSHIMLRTHSHLPPSPPTFPPCCAGAPAEPFRAVHVDVECGQHGQSAAKGVGGKAAGGNTGAARGSTIAPGPLNSLSQSQSHALGRGMYN